MQGFGDGLLPYGLRRVLPADADGLADGVVEQLERAVTVGLFGDGERLPTEIQLAEMLGVSTGTLRQGLSKLRARGLVETRRGRGGGSYVRDAPPQNANRALERLQASSVDSLRDLGDSCAAVAGMSARLAAQRGLDPEFVRLDKRVADFAEADSPTARRRADSRFHLEVAVIAQSVRLATTLVQLLGELTPLRWDTDVNESLSRSMSDHAAIARAVSMRDADVAQKLAQDHFMHEARVLIDIRLQIAAH